MSSRTPHSHWGINHRCHLLYHAPLNLFHPSTKHHTCMIQGCNLDPGKLSSNGQNLANELSSLSRSGIDRALDSILQYFTGNFTYIVKSWKVQEFFCAEHREFRSHTWYSSFSSSENLVAPSESSIKSSWPREHSIPCIHTFSCQ